MSDPEHPLTGHSLSRRGFLAGTGGAIIGIGLAGAGVADAATAPAQVANGATKATAPVDAIDPFIGALTTTANSACGKTFPGAVTPFGLVQLSPDTVSGGDNGSGYSADMTTIEGFSFLHLSGIGCYGDLGNLQVLPQTGDLIIDRDSAKSPFRKETEQARAGYYGVELDRYQVRAELTAAARAGIIRFTFHQGGTSRIKVDLTRRIGFDGSKSVTQCVTLLDSHTVEGSMYCDHTGGGWICGTSPTYTVYFSMRFQQPIATFGTWDGTEISTTLTERTGSNLGFYVEFPTSAEEVIEVKSGVSFVSVAGARANLAHDIPGWDFTAVAEAARAQWSAAVGKVTVDGGTPAQQQIFYTGLYHSMIDPRMFSDIDGSYRVGTGDPVNDHRVQRTVFSGWDVFRAQFPLQSIINPDVVADEINSLLALSDSADVTGLARWELLGIDTNTMLGDPAINIIAEAHAKGIRGFDVDKAYQYCRNVALGPASASNRTDFANWSQLGYCVTYSISATLENSYTDYALAQFATATGHPDDATALAKTAQNYRNIFNSDVGWFRGRNADGSWMGPDDGCIESNPLQQGWFVPHDVQGLIDLVGGPAAFISQLDNVFEQTPPDQMAVWNNFYNHSNEPVHQMAFMFVYAGAPWLTQKWSRYICEYAYGTGPSGLVGNDDCGQMSAWYVMAAAGLYSVAPVTGIYVIGSPVFDRITFNTGARTKFTVRAIGNSATNIYVQSATLNGRPLPKAWLTHEQVMAGGELVLTMGGQPNTGWASAPEYAPPSQTRP